ncbi:hypothetical protein CYMTET_18381 [Cymbomonas tetramitiformis]|uniref:Uncharacterized protein n=1 Tax=Cymbomonas tetramitiformis TaxID=36881 RepID=A0AAE0L5Z4_9CHLO|nr:hypothetical protein CYMTET_18381 [Cymbomonas tetramitiformis]
MVAGKAAAVEMVVTEETRVVTEEMEVVAGTEEPVVMVAGRRGGGDGGDGGDEGGDGGDGGGGGHLEEAMGGVMVAGKAVAVGMGARSVAMEAGVVTVVAAVRAAELVGRGGLVQGEVREVEAGQAEGMGLGAERVEVVGKEAVRAAPEEGKGPEEVTGVREAVEEREAVTEAMEEARGLVG